MDVGALDAENPNHLIIWLDQHIGQPEWCQHLKRAFSTQTDPKTSVAVNLSDCDLGIIRHVESAFPINFDGVCYSMAVFTDIDSCLHCFEHNKHRRIIFITSETLGKVVVPIILERFKDMFIDPVTKEPYMFIYIFCHNIANQVEWALDYRDYVQMFDFDADLLARVLRDIGNYYFTEGRRLLGESPPNNVAAYHRLRWARILYQRHSQMEQVSMSHEFDEISHLLENIEEELRSSSNDDDD
ncbi:unnamed protein product [Rotaria magnacalcarata]|uniref:Uncharacterized protein n=1 Tax=Rotaria magnacalcarata TaxID=392030 RepID=A0A816LH22_9BILA|nr:unnamed protein product [Rotaria magnacalcarata]CAF3985382.1 unnamed protein product [Rotaria magnacalcarata]